MTDSTFRTLLGIMVLVLVVAIAWDRLSRNGWSMFPAGRTVADPMDQLAQQGGPMAGGIAPAPARPLQGTAAQVHPDSGSGVIYVRDASIVPEAVVSTFRYEARHPFCGGLRPYGAWSVSTGWTLSDWQYCENTAWNVAANVSGASYGSVVPLVTGTTGASITYDNASSPTVVTRATSVDGITYVSTTGTTSGVRFTGTNRDTDHFTAALEYQRVGDFDRALGEYQAVLATDARSAEAYNNLGVLYQSRGQTSEAIIEFQRATAIDRTYTKAFNNLGVALLQAGRPGEATTELQWILRQEPTNPDAMANLAIVYESTGRREEARELLQRALTFNSRHVTAHYTLARLFDDVGETVKAVEHYEAFLSSGGDRHSGVAGPVRRRVVELNDWLAQYVPPPGRSTR